MIRPILEPRTALSAAVVVYMLALRVWFDVTVPPMGDESYYWVWGQHLAWSYFDHPPLNAWLLSLVAPIFGWSPVSLRLLTWVSLAAIAAVVWAIARQMGEARHFVFWRTMAVFLTVPVIALFTTPAFNDHLLVVFCVASLFCFWRFVVGAENGGRWVGPLYGAAALLGLAVLSKYNGALLGLGYVAFLVARPALRKTLLTPHPYLSSLLAIAIQGPVIYWNLTEGLASIHFHFVERSGHWGHPDFRQATVLILQGLVGAGPILVLAAILQPPWVLPGQARTLRDLALTVAAASTIVMIVVATNVEVLLHWNIVAYLALALIGAFALARAWLFVPHALLTLFLATSATANYSMGPNTLPGFVDTGTAANFGWPEVGASVERARKAHPEAFLAATIYTFAAQLSFQLHDLNVTALNPLRSQYDFWWTPAAHTGQDAIILADKAHPIELSSRQFRFVTKLEDVPVMRSGKQIWTFELYLGQGYDGLADGATP